MSILELHVQVDIVQTVVQDEILGQITQRHCDKPRWPSCYDLGYHAGKNARSGIACHTGHSESYCAVYEAENRSSVSSSNNGGAVMGTTCSSESDKI